MGVGVSEERCLARAREYSEWCGNKMYQQIIATFTPTGATRAYPPDDVVEAASRAAEGAGGDALADELPVLVPSSAVAYFDHVVLVSILANTLLMTFTYFEGSVNM